MKVSKKLDFAGNITLDIDTENKIRGSIGSNVEKMVITFNCDEIHIKQFIDNLNNDLNIKINGKIIPLKKNGNTFTCEYSDEIKSLDVLLQNFDIAKFEQHDGDLKLKDETLIDSYFIKNSILNQHVDFSDLKKNETKIKTDLHTHYAGAPSAQGLIELGIKENFEYPTRLLQELGIKIDPSLKTYPLYKLSSEELKKIENAMQIGVGEQIRFSQDEVNLQKIYAFRQPFFRDSKLTPQLLELIAKEYTKSGVSYVELSGSHIFDLDKEPQMLKLATETIPKLEEKYGVKLRFLGAMCRRDDVEWSLDELEKLKLVANNPYIAGIDVVGHETNSTLDVVKNIEPYMAFAKEKGLDWTFRFHAGENPSHPENVKEALKLADKYGVKVRIGHGLYGIDQETLDLAKKTNAIIEINSTSNLSLNNVTDVLEMMPMVEYLNNGIPVVLGTDSPGIYQTDPEQELIIAKRLLAKKGINEELLNKIFNTENKVISDRKLEEERLLKIPKCLDIPSVDKFKGLSKRWTQEVEIRKNVQKVEKLNEMINQINSLNSQYIDSSNISSFLSSAHKIPFIISGASKSNWETLSLIEKEKINLEMNKLLESLDPKKYILVTGGTDYGVEKIIHDKAKNRGFEVLGVLTESAEISEINNPNISNYTVVGGDWWAKSSFVMDNIIKPHHGKVLFVAGGSIVADEILSSVYHKIPEDSLFIMNGVGGSSEKKAKQLPKFAIDEISDITDKIKAEKIKTISEKISTLRTNNLKKVDIENSKGP